MHCQFDDRKDEMNKVSKKLMARKPKGKNRAYKEWAPSVKLLQKKYERYLRNENLTFAIVVSMDFTSPMSCWWDTITVFTVLACDLMDSWRDDRKDEMITVEPRYNERPTGKMWSPFQGFFSCFTIALVKNIVCYGEDFVI